jgi:two-component system phosphate regulon sensor histidine kinase PhoR
LRKQFSGLRNPLIKQRENQNFEDVPRHHYEEIDLIVNEINLLGQKLQSSREKLESHREQLITIFNSLNEGVAAFNNKGVAILHNLAFRKILGISDNYESGIRFYDWIHFPPIIQDIEEFIEKGIPIKKRSKFYGNRFIEYQVSPLKMNDKLLAGFLLTLADVTQLQQLETIRQDFVANVSHEFKTPLTSIRGYAETLLSGTAEKKKEREKFLYKIQNQTIHLENLVTDLLQLSRIEKRKTDELEKMKPLPVIRNLLKDYEQIVNEKKLTLHSEFSDVGSKLKIKGNEQLLQNIISNLLSNAVNYNKPGGEIWFRISKRKKILRIEVQDNGLGIPASQQERIFERFYRAESTRYLFQEGTGLGLSIVKHAVELLSGTLGVESEENKGSLFWIELPLL